MDVEERGFVCPKCHRVQTWAHDFMASDEAVDVLSHAKRVVVRLFTDGDSRIDWLDEADVAPQINNDFKNTPKQS